MWVRAREAVCFIIFYILYATQLVWEMLTGQVPFKDLESFAVMFVVGQAGETLPIPAETPAPLRALMCVAVTDIAMPLPLFISSLRSRLYGPHTALALACRDACFQRDASLRPAFSDVIGQLDAMRRSPSLAGEVGAFHVSMATWSGSIHDSYGRMRRLQGEFQQMVRAVPCRPLVLILQSHATDGQCSPRCFISQLQNWTLNGQPPDARGNQGDRPP
jgi:hypothetical protein